MVQITRERAQIEIPKLSRKVKVFALGWGDSRWLDEDFEDVKTADEAELIILPGGADINPKLYGEKPGFRTSFYQLVDDRQVSVYETYKDKVKFFGICRGLQLLAALAGQKLVQHISHPSSHVIQTHDGLTLYTNSLHHQQVYLCNGKEGEDYKLLAWAPRLSRTHLNGEDVDYKFPSDYKEPEVVVFPKINSMGIQGHPEFGGMEETTSNWLIKEIKLNLFNDLIIK